MFARLAEVGLNVAAAVSVARLPAELRPVDAPLDHSFVLLGHGGRQLWSQLPKPLDSGPHPIDRFVLAQVRARCAELGDNDPRFYYPGPGEPIPLQRLGRHLNLARPSLLGLDLHSIYGPWFAYRAAFTTCASLPELIQPAFEPPCIRCTDKPCQSACPPKAVRTEGFALSTCADFRLSAESPCLERCLARIACPVGGEHRYSEEQLRYHMVRPAHLRRLADYKS